MIDTPKCAGTNFKACFQGPWDCIFLEGLANKESGKRCHGERHQVQIRVYKEETSPALHAAPFLEFP